MNDMHITFSDALRFLFIGLLPFFLLYVCEKNFVVSLLKDIGIIGISLCALLIGSIFYFVYKGTFYLYFVMRLQDAFRRSSDNYRTYLKKQYVVDYRQAYNLWLQVKHAEFKDLILPLAKEASGIHLLYMSGIITAAFALWQFIISKGILAGLMAAFTLVFWISAFLLDRFLEDFEFRLLLSIEEKKLDTYVEKSGIKKRE